MKFYTLFILGMYSSLLVVITPDSAFSQCDEQYYYWIAGSGEWSNPENWIHQEWDPDMNDCIDFYGVPSCDDWPNLDSTGPIYINDTACQTGGYVSAEVMEIETGTYKLQDGHFLGNFINIGHGGIGSFEQSGGISEGLWSWSNDVVLGVSAGSQGIYTLSGGSLSTNQLRVGEYGTGTFTQTGGEVTNLFVVVGNYGSGTFVQANGDVSSEYLNIGWDADSNGTYILYNGQLFVQWYTFVGWEGIGYFNQSGGTLTCGEGFGLGHFPGAQGTYTMSDGSLTTNWMNVGSEGSGTVIQTGGVVIVDKLDVGNKPNGEGRYELHGGTINVADDIEVPDEGNGVFIMDDGTVNGTSEGATLSVNTRKGSLTGQGDFNIEVVFWDYFEDSNGTSVAGAIFEPRCLTRIEDFTITRLTPEDFAGGTIPTILPSSVYKLSFGGDFCEEFSVVISYDVNELAALGGDENDLVILQETSPNTYKILTGTFLLKEEEFIAVLAKANEFGKFAVAILPPVSLKKFEINQCFQEVGGTSQMYDLIETKPFLAKATLESNQPMIVNVKLKVSDAATHEQKAEKVLNGILVNSGSPTDCNFKFDRNMTKDMQAGDYTFSLEVKKQGNDVNIFNWSENYSFKSSKIIRIIVIREVDFAGTLFPRWEDTDLRFVEQVFPIPDREAENVNHIKTISFDYLWCCPNESNQWKGNHLLEIMNLFLNNYNNSNPPADFICAVVSDEVLGNSLGYTNYELKGILINKPNNYGGSEKTLGHEMGHIYDLGEEYVQSQKEANAPCFILNQWFEFQNNPPVVKRDLSGPFIIAPDRPNQNQRCAWADDMSSYDFANKLETDTLLWCTGRYIGDGGYNTSNWSYEPNNLFSMMSGTNPMDKRSWNKWISGPEYKWLCSKLTGSTVESRALSLFSSGQKMLISGSIDKTQQTAYLNPIIPVPNLDLALEAVEPNCRLVFKSGTGEVLGSFNINPLKIEEPDSGSNEPFSVVVDLPADTVRIQVCIYGEVAAELQHTDNSPEVSVLSPNGGEELPGGVTITWSASDADANDANNLRCTVEFSHNNGIDWSILAINLDVNNLTVDSNYLPGGPNCLVKVIVSDGWNSSEDTSDAIFSVLTKPPVVTILDPEDGATLSVSDSIVGRCTAYDPETGDITDANAIQWSSNIDGFLGKGDLTSFHLSLGNHILSVTVTDPESKIAYDSVRIRVIANVADFNFDQRVDLFDFALFANKWYESCSGSDWWCEGSDLDFSDIVDESDLVIFVRHWLQGVTP